MDMDECTKDCQTLIMEGPTCHGWLRQKSMAHRIGEAIGKSINGLQPIASKVVNKVPWDQRYVILRNEFLFVFRDETSKKSERVIRMAEFCEADLAEPDNTDVPWPFKLIRKDKSKELLFAATSQEEQKKWLKLIRERLEKMPKSDPPKRRNNNNNKNSSSSSSNNNKVKNIKSVKFNKNDDSDDDDVGTNYVTGNEKDDDDDDDDYSDLEKDEKMDDYEIPSVESGKDSIKNEKLNKRWDVPLPAIPVDQRRSKNSRNNKEDEDDSLAIYDEPDELPAAPTKSRSPSSTTTPPTTTSVSKISSKLAGRIAAVENNVANSISPKAPMLPAKKPPPTPLKYEPTFPNLERRSQDSNNARIPDKPKEKPPTLKKPGRPEMKVSPQVQTPKPAVPRPNVELVYEIDSLSVNYSALVDKAMWNKDPNKATEVMSAIIKVIGAFLIRKSTDGDGYTLSVACEDGPKKFKIACKESQLVMDGNTFDDMSKLIEYYFTNNLPHKSHKLSKPYSELWSST